MAVSVSLFDRQIGRNERSAYAVDRYRVAGALSPADALAASGLPAYGDAYPDDSGIRVTNIVAKLVVEAENVSGGVPSQRYEVDVEYGVGGGALSNTAPTPPLAKQFGWSFGLQAGRVEADVISGQQIGPNGMWIQDAAPATTFSFKYLTPENDYGDEFGANIDEPTIGFEVTMPSGTPLAIGTWLAAMRRPCNSAPVTVQGYTIPSECVRYLGPTFRESSVSGQFYIVHRHLISWIEIPPDKPTFPQFTVVQNWDGVAWPATWEDTGVRLIPQRYAATPIRMKYRDAGVDKVGIYQLRVSRRYKTTDFVAAGIV